MSCVFCELLRTGEANWIANEPDAVAFLPLADSSLAPGHTLVIPRRHCVGVLDAPTEALEAAIGLAQRVGQAMVAALAATGVVMLNASGPHSGQSVGHLHFHVVPRWPDCQADMWPVDRSQHVTTGDVRQLLASHFS